MAESIADLYAAREVLRERIDLTNRSYPRDNASVINLSRQLRELESVLTARVLALADEYSPPRNSAERPQTTGN